MDSLCHAIRIVQYFYDFTLILYVIKVKDKFSSLPALKMPAEYVPCRWH